MKSKYPISILFFIILVFSFSGISNAQDSIHLVKTQLLSESDQETKSQLLLKVLGYHAKRGQLNRDSLKKYSNQLVDLLEDAPPSDTKAKAKAYRLLAGFRLPFKEYAPLARDLIEDYMALENHSGVLTEQFYLANKAHTAGDFSSFSEYEKGLEYIETYKDIIGVEQACLKKAKFLSSLASNYEYVHLFEDALNIAFKAVEHAETCGDSLGLLFAYRSTSAIMGNAMGDVHFDVESSPFTEQTLLEYLQKTYHLAQELEKRDIETLAAYNLAYYYVKIDSLQEALDYLSKSESVPDIEWMDRQRFSNYTLFSDIYKKRGDLSRSLTYLRQAKEKAFALNEPAYAFDAMINLTQWAIDIRDVGMAGQYIQELETITNLSLEMETDLSEVQFAYNKLIGNTEAALIAGERFYLLKDSLSALSSARSIGALLARNEVVQANKEIISLKNANLENEVRYHKRLAWSGIGLVSLLLVGVALFFWYQSRLIKSEREKDGIRQQLFRAQMNPHFIFNTLGSIQSFFLQSQKAKEAVFYLSKFSKLMRQILVQSEQEFISLKEEMETIEYYLLLQKMRFDGRFDYKFEIADGVDAEKVMVPPMILQPIVENAIEHGKIYNKENGIVSIMITPENKNSLKILIRDNGIGLEESRNASKVSTKKSMSLNIVRKRLDYLSQKLNTAAQLTLDATTQEGTCVQLLMPNL